jgi:hypothetical protein
MFTLFWHVFGRFGITIHQRPNVMRWGLADCVSHQDDLMLSLCLAYDLNRDLGCRSWSVSKKSASTFSRTSWDRLSGRVVQSKEPQWIDLVVHL